MRAGFVVKVAGVLAAFAVAVLLARALEPAGYGLYAYAFALMSVIGIPTQLGLPHLVVRQTAIAVDARDSDAVLRVWRWSAAASLLAAATIIGVSLVVLWLLPQALGGARGPFLWALALLPLIAFGNLGAGALRGLGRVTTGLAAEHVVRQVLFLSLIVTLVVAAGGLDARTAMVAHVAAAGGAAAFAWVRATSVRLPSGGAVASGFGSLWLRSALLLGIVSAAHLVNMRLDILMIGALLDAADVGVYQVAQSGANLVALGASAAGLVAAPEFARLHARADTAALQALCKRAARFALLVSAPAALALILVGAPLVGIAFGDAYRPAAAPLAWLAAAQLLSAAFGPVGVLLNMGHHEAVTVRGVATAAVVNVVLNAVLIPTLGISGAAIATAVSVVVWNVLLWRAARRLLGVDSTAL